MLWYCMKFLEPSFHFLEQQKMVLTPSTGTLSQGRWSKEAEKREIKMEWKQHVAEYFFQMLTYSLDSKPASKLSGVLWRRGRKRKEEFENLHRKSQCEMLIGRDDISNDIITLGTRFSKFVYIRADWRKSNNSVDREAQGNWRWNSNSRDVVASPPSFSHPAARLPWRARRLFDEIWTSPPNFIFMDFKSYFPVLIFPWNYLPCVCNLEYNFNTVLHCTHAKLQGIWYGYICLWQHSFHGNGKNSFLK